MKVIRVSIRPDIIVSSGGTVGVVPPFSEPSWNIQVPSLQAWKWQQDLVSGVLSEDGSGRVGSVLLLQHLPVLTLGAGSTEDHLRCTELAWAFIQRDGASGGTELDSSFLTVQCVRFKIVNSWLQMVWQDRHPPTPPACTKMSPPTCRFPLNLW